MSEDFSVMLACGVPPDAAWASTPAANTAANVPTHMIARLTLVHMILLLRCCNLTATNSFGCTGTFHSLLKRSTPPLSAEFLSAFTLKFETSHCRIRSLARRNKKADAPGIREGQPSCRQLVFHQLRVDLTAVYGSRSDTTVPCCCGCSSWFTTMLCTPP